MRMHCWIARNAAAGRSPMAWAVIMPVMWPVNGWSVSWLRCQLEAASINASTRSDAACAASTTNCNPPMAWQVSCSTVVVLLLEHERAACIWAGDSRCYLWRSQCLYQLSRDHSLQQQLMDEQQLSLERARSHPDARALTRAIGARQPLSLEILEFRLYPGDVFLLCSDGLYQGLRHRELGSAMSAGMPWQVVDRLFVQALRGPALDDLTAVVVQS